MTGDEFTKKYELSLKVDCPTCNAKKGKRCLNRKNGQPFDNRAYHAERLALAQN